MEFLIPDLLRPLKSNARQLRQKLGNTFLQFLTRFELYDNSFRDDDFVFRSVGITSNFGSCFSYAEGAEIPNYDIIVICEASSNILHRVLNHIKHLLLSQSCFVTNLYDEISLGYGSHVV